MSILELTQSAAAEFIADVQIGLSRRQKEISSRYLYDELGSALFEAITVLPEYGLTRADSRLLQRYAGELPPYSTVAELGAGCGTKTRWILEALRPARYLPIDVSASALDRCRRELEGFAQIDAVVGTYLEGMREVVAQRNQAEPLLLLFLGSTVGNFESRCREDFLKQIRSRLQPGDGFLIGFDLVKPLDQMLVAYDDPAGVTAAFNLNLLGRANRELGADFVLRNFEHVARYDDREQRIEMHLRSRCEQRVFIKAANFHCDFHAGETIWTESSYKFRPDQIVKMAESSGFTCERQWMDEQWPFAESFWIAR